MTRRGLGVLLLVSLIAILATVFQDFRFETMIARERAAAANLDRELGTLAVAIADFRAAQAAYVATGQDSAFWIKRAADVAAQIESAVEHLQSSSMDPSVRTHGVAAASILRELGGADRRARDYVTSDQRYLASDAIFVDGIGVSRRLESELDAAREAGRRASEARIERLALWRQVMHGGALALVFLVAFLGFRSVVANETASASEAAIPAAIEPVALIAPRPSPPPPPPVAVPPPVLVAPGAPAHAVNLTDVADLCVELGRVQNGREMPALLGRAASALDAKGLVLWVVDTSGAFLRPLLAHGYSPTVMQRLGGLQVDANNVTSLAYRSALPQVMNGATPEASGAIAVPVLTAARCIGVLAAETNRARPERDTVSAARMVAAQLAALAVPTDSSVTAQRNAAKSGQGKALKSEEPDA